MKNLDELPDSGLLTSKEAVEYIPLSVDTLNVYRKQCKGPLCTRIGGRYYYKVEHLKQYMKGEVLPNDGV